MELGSLLFSAGAGFIAFFAPCSVSLIPAYIGYALGENSTTRAPGRLIGYGLVSGSGLLLVFALFGVLFAWLGSLVTAVIPAVELTAGLLLLFFGTAAVSGHAFAVRLPSLPFVGRGPMGRFFSFGTAYGLGALGCSLPVFLVVMSQAFIARGLTGAVMQFLAYGGVMVILMTAVFGVSAVSQTFVARHLAPRLGAIQKAGGLLVAVAGMIMVSRGFLVLL